MMNCNKCIRLAIVIKGKGEDAHISNACLKHKVDLKLTVKPFKDSIFPCKACSGKDYESKEGVILGKL